MARAPTSPKPIDLVLANGQPAGGITIPLDKAPAPCRVTLHAQVVAANGTVQAHNHWDLWVYPKTLPEPDASQQVMIASTLDAAVCKHVEAGGRVLLAPGPGGFAETLPGGFTPVFWNQVWAKGQQPETLGVVGARPTPRAGGVSHPQPQRLAMA